MVQVTLRLARDDNSQFSQRNTFFDGHVWCFRPYINSPEGIVQKAEIKSILEVDKPTLSCS